MTSDPRKTSARASSSTTQPAVAGASGLSASFALRGRDLPAQLMSNQLSKEEEEEAYAAKRRLRERYPYNDHSALPSAVNSDDEGDVQVKQGAQTNGEDEEQRGRGRGRSGMPRDERSSEGRGSRTRSKSTEERRASGSAVRRVSESERTAVQKKGALKTAQPSADKSKSAATTSSEKKVAFASVNQEVEARPVAAEEQSEEGTHDEALFEIDEDLDAEEMAATSPDAAQGSKQMAMTEALGELAIADEKANTVDDEPASRANTGNLAQSLSQAGSLSAMMASEQRHKLPDNDETLEDVAAAPNFDPTSLQFDGRRVQYYNPVDGTSSTSPVLLKTSRRGAGSSRERQHRDARHNGEKLTKITQSDAMLSGFPDIAYKQSMIGFRVSIGEAEALLSGLLAPNAPSHRNLWSRQGNVHRKGTTDLDVIDENGDEDLSPARGDGGEVKTSTDSESEPRNAVKSTQLAAQKPREIAPRDPLASSNASSDASMLARSVPIQMSPASGRRSVSSGSRRDTTSRYDLEPKTSVPYREKRMTPSLLKAARQSQRRVSGHRSSLGAISDASEPGSSSDVTGKSQSSMITPGSVPKTRRPSVGSPQSSFKYSVPQAAPGSIQRGFGLPASNMLQAPSQVLLSGSQSSMLPTHVPGLTPPSRSPYTPPPPPTSYNLRLEPDDKHRPASLPLAPIRESDVASGGADRDAIMNETLAFIHILENLKLYKRTGWYHHRISVPESIADHMYRMAVLSILLPSETLDIGKCVQLSVVHDLAESLVGDLTPLDNVPKEEKHRREHEAILHLVHDRLGSSRAALRIEALWNEYEARETPESRAVKDLDRFELAVQAVEYERANNTTDLQPFFNGCTGDIQHPEVKHWVHALAREREQLWSKTPYKYTQEYPVESEAGAASTSKQADEQTSQQRANDAMDSPAE